LKKIDHNIGFLEKRQFFAENWQKSTKIVIITSTPDQGDYPWRSIAVVVKDAGKVELVLKLVGERGVEWVAAPFGLPAAPVTGERKPDEKTDLWANLSKVNCFCKIVAAPWFYIELLLFRQLLRNTP
jgi:hypothetical protein